MLCFRLVFLDDLDRKAHTGLLILEILGRPLRKWKLAVDFLVGVRDHSVKLVERGEAR